MKKFLSDQRIYLTGRCHEHGHLHHHRRRFTAIVTSLVNDIITPILGIIIGGLDFTGITVSVGDSMILIGNFVQAVIVFLLTALVIFSIMKAFNKLQRKKEEPAPEPEKPSEEVQLLTEIRDLLSEQREYNENR